MCVRYGHCCVIRCLSFGFVRRETGLTHNHTTRTPSHNTRHDKNNTTNDHTKIHPHIGFVNRTDVIWYKLGVFALEGGVFA